MYLERQVLNLPREFLQLFAARLEPVQQALYAIMLSLFKPRHQLRALLTAFDYVLASFFMRG